MLNKAKVKSVLKPKISNYPKNLEGLFKYLECDPESSKNYISFLNQFGFLDKGSDYGLSSWFHDHRGYHKCQLWLPRFDFEGKFLFNPDPNSSRVPKQMLNLDIRNPEDRKTIKEEIVNPFTEDVLNEFEVYDSIESLSFAPFSLGNKEAVERLIDKDIFVLFLSNDIYVLNNYKRDIRIQLGMKAFNSSKIIGFKRNILRAKPYEEENLMNIKAAKELKESQAAAKNEFKLKDKDFWMTF